MSDIYNVWKKKERRVPRALPPMIGMVYKGVDKFFGKTVEGMLIEMFNQNDEAVLKTIDNKLISVDIKSLQIILNK
jgi:hypothetical protein